MQIHVEEKNAEEWQQYQAIRCRQNYSQLDRRRHPLCHVHWMSEDLGDPY